MLFKGIEHLALVAKDTVALSRWYRETFGFVEVYNNKKEPPTIFLKAPDGMMIEFLGANKNPRLSSDAKDLGWRHISITVDIIDEGIKYLEKRGIKWMGDTQVSASSGTKARFFWDPEGNILHLIERPTPL